MLGSTLQKLATDGRDAFYKGEIAQTIARFMEENGGYISYEDLSSHSSTWIEPVSTSYRGYDLWELPPNGQGIAALQMLNMLELFDLKKDPEESNNLFQHEPEVAARLQKRLQAYHQTAVTPNIPPNKKPRDFKIPAVWGEGKFESR